MRIPKPTSLIASVTLLALILLPQAAKAHQTGLMEFTVSDQAGGRNTNGFIWYPADQSEKLVAALGNPVWEPIQVAPEAEPLPGKRPLVILSHGMFGNARNQAWLAEGLVARGFIVAAIDHPGTSTFNRDPDQRRALWERPRDISRGLDALLSDPRVGPLIDKNRIYMAGHSLGGFTAVALAGGRINPAQIDAFCGTHATDAACVAFTNWQVARTHEDRIAIAQDLSDPRLRAFAVLDPGGTPSFSKESLAAIGRPLIVYGAPLGGHLDLNVEARALVAGLPPSRVVYREPANLSHFDFLGLCTANGFSILKEEEPDEAFVCEAGRTERQAKHAKIIEELVAFFSNH